MRRSTVERLSNFAAGLAMLPTGLLALSSGLLAPPWAVAFFVVVWFAGVAVMCRLRPLLRPVVPVAFVALWFVVLSAGDVMLGWTA